MDIIWIEVSQDGNSVIDLETQQEVTLHDYPPQAAVTGNMDIPSCYNGKVILVVGIKQLPQIYSAKIKGALE